MVLGSSGGKVHIYMIITVSTCQSFGTTNMQITQCKAYKYYFHNSSPVSTSIWFYNNRYIGTQHIKVQKIFLVPPNWHFLCILTLSSQVSAKSFGAIKSNCWCLLGKLTRILAMSSSSMLKPQLVRTIISGKQKVQKPLLTVKCLALFLSSPAE